MPKPKQMHHSAREQEVLDKVDYYRIRVYQFGKGWVDSIPLQASEVLPRYQRIKNMNYRAVLYAARVFEDGEHLANVTPAFVSALIQH